MMLGLSAALVIGAACGDDDDDDADPTPPTGGATQPAGGDDEFDYGALDGDLDIDGSSTVFPITQAVAEEFQAVADGVAVTVGFVGTGGGAEKFCRGEIQLWDASRPARETDLKNGCDPAEVETVDDLVEFQVGIDALSIVVNPDNDWAECMTLEQLNMAFKDGGATNWSDIDPSWPNQKIVFYYPGTDSGTYDYFVEEAIEGVNEDDAHRTDGTSSEDDNVLAIGVEQDKNAIGYFGFAYFQEAGDSLKAVEVDGGDGCVEPTFDNALAGDYPLSRPLFIYSSDPILADSPAAVGFMHFLFENIGLVAESGYITLPDDLLEEQVAKLEPYLE